MFVAPWAMKEGHPLHARSLRILRKVISRKDNLKSHNWEGVEGQDDIFASEGCPFHMRSGGRSI